MEKDFHRFLVERGLEFKKDFFREKIFDDLISVKGYHLRYDFWFPLKKLLIELDGEQHYKYKPGLHKNQTEFNNQVENDKLKDEYAKNNGLKLVRVKQVDFGKWLNDLKDKFIK